MSNFVELFLILIIVGLSVQQVTKKAYNQKISGVVATGDRVLVYDNANNQKCDYGIVIYGDTDSDGKVSLVDLARVQKHLLQQMKRVERNFIFSLLMHMKAVLKIGK